MGEEYNTFLCAYAMEMIMRDRKNYKYWMLHAVSIRAWLKAHHADAYEQLYNFPQFFDENFGDKCSLR